MARPLTIPDNLAESILATLALDDRWGRVIASSLSPDYFDPDARPREVAVEVPPEKV